MAIVEYYIKATSEDITGLVSGPVNDCVIHHCKPTFTKSTAVRNKRNIMLVVRCKSEDCMRCCDGYYGIDPMNPFKEIVDIWNKYNPRILKHSEHHTI